MITLAQMLQLNNEAHKYAFIQNGKLVPLDPSLPEFPEPNKFSLSYVPEDSGKIWCVTSSSNSENWIVSESFYENLTDFIESHKFTITLKELDLLQN